METLSENTTPTSVDYTTLQPKEFAKAIKQPDIFLIDVRHPDEYETGHLSGATNIDVLDPDFLTKAKSILPKDKTIAVYCGTGKRSAMASEQLSSNGYQIINLAGGLQAWNATFPSSQSAA